MRDRQVRTDREATTLPNRPSDIGDPAMAAHPNLDILFTEDQVKRRVTELAAEPPGGPPGRALSSPIR